jgi:hypothetical protein
VNRNDFKEIALIRLREAKVLLDNGNYEGVVHGADATPGNDEKKIRQRIKSAN